MFGTSETTAQGGAVYLSAASSFVVQGNSGAVTFAGNSAEEGGGIYAAGGSVVSISDNANGVTFEQNTVQNGSPFVEAVVTAAERLLRQLTALLRTHGTQRTLCYTFHPQHPPHKMP